MAIAHSEGAERTALGASLTHPPTRQPWNRTGQRPPIEKDVLRGLLGRPKRLPAYLFYDEQGSALFEQITELPEYYLTRAERSIFEHQSGQIVDAALAPDGACARVIELGAGTASKSQLLLRAIAQRSGRCLFYPVDVSPTALAHARTRIEAQDPDVSVRPLVMRNEEALATLRRWTGRSVVLFIGSSIGNDDQDDAVSLLRRIRSALVPGSVLLLGTDRRKSHEVLIPAYDDAQGVTAAFNKNILAHINRELGGQFVLDRFRHVAIWNDAASRMEMHLESTVDQLVAIQTSGREISFRKGERIHTESSHKYDLATVERMLARAGFRLERTFDDDDHLFWVHLARVV